MIRPRCFVRAVEERVGHVDAPAGERLQRHARFRVRRSCTSCAPARGMSTAIHGLSTICVGAWLLDAGARPPSRPRVFAGARRAPLARALLRRGVRAARRALPAGDEVGTGPIRWTIDAPR